MLALSVTVAFGIVMTSCSGDDEGFIEGGSTSEGTAGATVHVIPATVSAVRANNAESSNDDEAEPSSRATYDSGTKKLTFSEGDKLLVTGTHSTAGSFAGVLDLEDASEGEFKGEIYTQNPYTEGIDELLSAANPVSATLLPNGYADYGYLTVTGSEYLQSLTVEKTKAFVTLADADATKALAIEQLSYETATSYNECFSLAPKNAIINYAISGLTASTDHSLSVTDGTTAVSGKATSDDSGKAYFAVGYTADGKSKNYTLSIPGFKVIKASGRTLVASKVYNIATAAASSTKSLAEATKDDLAKAVCTNGHIHDIVDVVNCGGKACGIIAYVGSATCESSYTHGLAISLKDANNGNTAKWKSSTGTRDNGSDKQYVLIGEALSANESGSTLSSGRTNATTWPAFSAALSNSISISDDESSLISKDAPSNSSGWFLPSIKQWNQIVNGLTGTTTAFTKSTNYALGANKFNSKITAAGGTALQASSSYYWSSTEYSTSSAWIYNSYGGVPSNKAKTTTTGMYVRACFAF